MPDPGRIDSLRAVRDNARVQFDSSLEQVKSDFGARSLGSRITSKVTEDTRAAAVYALDVARDNKGIVVGTLAAVVLWFFRNPIIEWIERHFGDDELPEPAEDNLEDSTDG
jgi:hypothetical protein